ncbi:MAG: hypothetical protein INR73_04255 [Williamsia sp.]|nr:hypothetical protein [Williamsia sp.]
MNVSSTDATQREEFFKKSFRGTFSYNMKVSSVNSFLRSMTQGNGQPSSAEDSTANGDKLGHNNNSQKDSSIH